MQTRQGTHSRSGLTDLLSRHPNWFLGLFTAWYLAAEICLNSRRPFWFDELVANSLANVPSIGQIWGLIERGIELNPPLTFWIQWLVAHTLGNGEVVSRLPAIFGFWLMCVCLYHFVRRRTDALYGFVALLFPVLTGSAEGATYARGYGLMLGSSAAALLAWQYAADGVHRKWALVLLAFATAVSVSNHYYAAYVTGAIGLGELVLTFGERKKLDAAVWIALAAGLAPLVFYMPLIRGAAAGAHAFWAQPELHYIRDSYVEMLGAALILALIWQWCFLTGKETLEPVPSGWPMHEAIACLALLAMPVVIGVAAQFVPLGFYPRYVQQVIIGGSVMIAIFAHRITSGSVRMRSITVGLLVWLGFVPWGLLHMVRAATVPPPAEVSQQRFHTLISSDLPFVLDNFNEAVRVYHYASPAVQERLFLLTDESRPVQFLGSDTMIRSLDLMNTIHPTHLVNYRHFVGKHQAFLVGVTNAESWIVQSLIADGVPVELVSYEKGAGSFAQELFVFRAGKR